MATPRERLVEWLRDSHATHEQAETMLRGTAGRMQNYPAFRQRLEDHALVSARHAEEIEDALATLNESPSVLKELTGKVTALGQTLSGLFVGDEVIKALLATHTFAHMQVASYRILDAAADAAGEPQVRELCSNLLDDEVQFADWLDGQLPVITTEYLSREAAGVTAKH